MTEVWRTLPISGRLFESARWLSAEACFQWVDILSSTIYRWDPNTDEITAHELGFDFLPLATPSTVPGVQVLASRDSLFTYAWGGEPQRFAQLPLGDRVRLNDGIVDADGRTWVGSMGLAPDVDNPLGKLWCVDSAGSFDEMSSDLVISNGIVWRDTVQGFHVDSLRRTVYSVRHREGALEREPFVSFQEPAEPDGIALRDDELWVALWGVGAIAKVDQMTGRSVQVAVPVDRPSSLAVSDQLVFVTSAGRDRAEGIDCTGQVLIADAAAVSC